MLSHYSFFFSSICEAWGGGTSTHANRQCGVWRVAMCTKYTISRTILMNVGKFRSSPIKQRDRDNCNLKAAPILFSFPHIHGPKVLWTWRCQSLARRAGSGTQYQIETLCVGFRSIMNNWFEIYLHEMQQRVAIATGGRVNCEIGKYERDRLLAITLPLSTLYFVPLNA